MIQMFIDKTNEDLRDLHLLKIKTQIGTLLNTKIGTFTVGSFEHTTFSWLITNLDELLIAKLDRLRILISQFNNLITSYIGTIVLTQDNYSSDLINMDELKQICRDARISNFSKKNKNVLSQHIFMHNHLINQNNNCNNQLKFRILNAKIDIFIQNIFIDFYEIEWDKINTYNRYKFVKKLNLKTCPYCNRNYIFVVDTGNGKLRPEIDHFFPKSIYPYLAMSFYNLIPSCQICNHTKKAKDSYTDGLLSPYEINENTFQFTYKPKSVNFLQVKKRKYNFSNFDIKFKSFDENSNKYFKLDKLYEQHKDIVLELLIKKTIYTKSYIKDLKRDFNFSDDEIYRFLLCNYKQVKDLHRRPLGKLIKDISEELNLI